MSFYLLAGMILISAALVVTLKNIFHCALALITVLLGLAALYFVLGAPFVGMMQLMIYVGAIMILILFAIMLTSRISDKVVSVSNRQVIPALLAVGCFLFLVLMPLSQTVLPQNPGGKFDPIFDLSYALMTTYLLPFEVISIVLLAVLVGAIALARKD